METRLRRALAYVSGRWDRHLRYHWHPLKIIFDFYDSDVHDGDRHCNIPLGQGVTYSSCAKISNAYFVAGKVETSLVSEQPQDCGYRERTVFVLGGPASSGYCKDNVYFDGPLSEPDVGRG